MNPGSAVHPERRRAALALVLMLGLPASVLAFQGGRIDRLSSLLVKARKALSEQRPGQAVAYLREARRIAPKDGAILEALVVANHRMAIQCEKVQDFVRAEDFARAAVEASPGRLECALLLARILEERDLAGDAEETYRAVLEKHPRSALAHSLFAGFLEKQQRRVEAQQQLEHALRLDPSSKSDRGKLEDIGRDLKVEGGFESRRSTHFELRYNPTVEPFGLHAAEILSTLELIHRDVARELGFAPQTRVTVLLYTGEEFGQVNQLGHWAAGFFDGRVRVEIRSWRDRREVATRTLRHEVTHAFICCEAPACPTWIHEGLAQIAEGSDIGPTRARVRSSPPLTAAQLRFARLGEDVGEARRFYDQCHVFMDYLLATKGRPAVLAAVCSMKPDAEGVPPDEDAVLRRDLGGTLEELLCAWLREQGDPLRR